jgi:hypothetical protein
MITVCVWKPMRIEGEKNVGHASMKVGDNTYISWWPDESATFGNYHPIRNKNYESDVRDEGHPPDFEIQIDGLDEQKIIDWWTSFGLVRGGEDLQGPMLPYNLISQNCSTVVALGLKAGDGDRYAGWYTSHCIVWRPMTVVDYAFSIRKGLLQRL